MRTPAETVEACDRRLACARHYLALDEEQGVTEDLEARRRDIARWERKRADAAAQIPQLPLGPAAALTQRRR